MKRRLPLKRYLILFSVVLTFFLCFILLWSERKSYSQSPLPPPVPVPLVPSVLEDIRNTRHNLSSIPPTDPNIQRAVYTAQTTEICIFCHTPHGAGAEATGIKAPLWN